MGTAYNKNCLFFQTRRADRVVTKIYESFFQKTGIHSAQCCFLHSIAAMNEPYISEIGTLMCMDQTTVTRNVSILQKEGLIETFSRPENSRRMHVRLTPLGQEKLEEGIIAWENAQSLAREHLGEDFDHLLKILNRLVEVLDYKN